MQNTKYGRLYTALISNAKQRSTQKGYFESHHITPRSLGGDNSNTNLVDLTAREHFIAHTLLFKHYTKLQDNQSAFKMALAIQLMQNGYVSKLSSFKISAGAARIYQKAKELISITMTGSGNPMYGKPSANKGKTHSEMYSVATLEKIAQHNIAKRKYTNNYTWVNIKTNEEIILPLQDFAKLKSLDYRKLIEIVRKDLSRRLHKSWTLKGLDYRNKYIRNACSIKYTFFNLLTKESYYLTLDEIMTEYIDLKYKGLLNMIRNNTNSKNCSYKNWTLEYTFNNRSK